MTGEQLKAMREEKGLGMTEAARLSGVTRAYIWQIEKGERSASKKTINRLLAAYAPEPETEPELPVGWLCPRCRRVNAPFVSYCCCKEAIK